MSRFKDIEQHLEEEVAAKQSAEEERVRKLLEARDGSLPLLHRSYTVFGDFYRIILEPRGYKVYPRKKEGLTPNEQRNIRNHTILYAYVANVRSPFSERPYPFESDTEVTWRNQSIGELDYHAWHPNIGLHFATLLTPKTSSVEEVKLTIEMRAWGSIAIDKDTLTPQGVRVFQADGGWDHQATYVTIDPDEPHLEDQIETGLRLLTPNIIHHKEAFRR